jgi:hypothetical protein
MHVIARGEFAPEKGDLVLLFEEKSVVRYWAVDSHDVSL